MSQIEWTEKTWNPVVGCSVTSPGCKNCYAMRTADRLARNPKLPGRYDGLTRRVKDKPVWTGAVRSAPDAVWEQPLRRRKPTIYFVNSMGDLFHPNVPDEWIDRAFAVMALSPQHQFQVLTKHPERMASWASSRTADPAPIGRAFDLMVEAEQARIKGSRKAAIVLGNGLVAAVSGLSMPLPNVWLGVSVEDQARADERIPLLLNTPAAVRFVSCEPLLGYVNLRCLADDGYGAIDALEAHTQAQMMEEWGPEETDRHGEQPALDWVIVGGESGPDARPMHPDWARSLRDQCTEAEVPFFFKQWGEWAPDVGPLPDGDPVLNRPAECYAWTGNGWRQFPTGFDLPDHFENDDCVYRIGKKAAGRALDGVVQDGMPEAGR